MARFGFLTDMLNCSTNGRCQLSRMNPAVPPSSLQVFPWRLSPLFCLAIYTRNCRVCNKTRIVTIQFVLFCFALRCVQQTRKYTFHPHLVTLPAPWHSPVSHSAFCAPCRLGSGRPSGEWWWRRCTWGRGSWSRSWWEHCLLQGVCGSVWRVSVVQFSWTSVPASSGALWRHSCIVVCTLKYKNNASRLRPALRNWREDDWEEDSENFYNSENSVKL